MVNNENQDNAQSSGSVWGSASINPLARLSGNDKKNKAKPRKEKEPKPERVKEPKKEKTTHSLFGRRTKEEPKVEANEEIQQPVLESPNSDTGGFVGIASSERINSFSLPDNREQTESALPDHDESIEEETSSEPPARKSFFMPVRPSEPKVIPDEPIIRSEESQLNPILPSSQPTTSLPPLPTLPASPPALKATESGIPLDLVEDETSEQDSLFSKLFNSKGAEPVEDIPLNPQEPIIQEDIIVVDPGDDISIAEIMEEPVLLPPPSVERPVFTVTSVPTVVESLEIDAHVEELTSQPVPAEFTISHTKNEVTPPAKLIPNVAITMTDEKIVSAEETSNEEVMENISTSPANEQRTKSLFGFNKKHSTLTSKKEKLEKPVKAEKSARPIKEKKEKPAKEPKPPRASRREKPAKPVKEVKEVKEKKARVSKSKEKTSVLSDGTEPPKKNRKGLFLILGTLAIAVTAILVIPMVVAPTENNQPSATGEPTVEPTTEPPMGDPISPEESQNYLAATDPESHLFLTLNTWLGSSNVSTIKSDPAYALLSLYTVYNYVLNSYANPYFYTNNWETKDRLNWVGPEYYLLPTFTPALAESFRTQFDEAVASDAGHRDHVNVLEFMDDYIYIANPELTGKDQVLFECSSEWIAEACRAPVFAFSNDGIEILDVQITDLSTEVTKPRFTVDLTFRMGIRYSDPMLATNGTYSEYRTYHIKAELNGTQPTTLTGDSYVMLISSITSNYDGEVDYDNRFFDE